MPMKKQIFKLNNVNELLRSYSGLALTELLLDRINLENRITNQ